jgi:hypothetical protein
MSTYCPDPKYRRWATAHVPSVAALAASLIGEMRPSMDRATHDLLLRIARVTTKERIRHIPAPQIA